MSGGKSHDLLCQNCVTCPSKPVANRVIYRDTSTHQSFADTRVATRTSNCVRPSKLARSLTAIWLSRRGG
jgi:hypothetical protein